MENQKRNKSSTAAATSSFSSGNLPGREEFRKYLERTGVVTSLTSALASLQMEYAKNDKIDAIEFLMDNLAHKYRPESPEIALRAEVFKLRTELEQSRQEVAELRAARLTLDEQPSASNPQGQEQKQDNKKNGGKDRK